MKCPLLLAKAHFCILTAYQTNMTETVKDGKKISVSNHLKLNYETYPVNN